MNDLATRLAHVNRLLRQGDGSAALQLSRNLLETHPDNLQVLRCVGLSLVQQRSHQEAIEVLTRVLVLEPCDRDVLYNLAGLFAGLRQPERARTYLDRLLRLMPLSSRVHSDAASNALVMNEVELAIQLGRRAVGLAPENTAARLTLAEALQAGGQFEQARSEYLAVLARDRGNAIALSGLLSLREGAVGRSGPASVEAFCRHQLLPALAGDVPISGRGRGVCRRGVLRRLRPDRLRRREPAPT